MSDAAVITDIRSMIDVAIGTPEVGVVDFCMLHTILHLLAQQLYALDKPVELRGSAAQTISPSTEGQTVAVTEYLVETTDSEKTMTIKPLPKQVEPTTLLVVERVRRDTQNMPHTESRGQGREKARQVRSGQDRSGGRSGTQDRDDNKREGERRGEQESGGQERPSYDRDMARSSAERLSLVTVSKFNMLEEAVHDLKERVYGTMPKNEDILEEVRSQGNLRAITDMWTNLNVSSRLEAAEAGLNKLSSLVEDLIKEGGLNIPLDSARVDRGATGKELPATIVDQVQQLRKEVGSLTQTFHDAMQQMLDGIDPIEALSNIMVPPGSAPGTMGGASEMYQDQSQGRDQSLVPSAAQSGTPMDHGSDVDHQSTGGAHQSAGGAHQSAGGARQSPGADLPASGAHRPAAGAGQLGPANHQVMERLFQLEKRVKECCDDKSKGHGTVSDQLNNFQDQLDHITQQVATLHDNFGKLQLSPSIGKDLEGLMKLYETVRDMQDQLRQVNDTALLLAGEKDERQRHMNALLEQIEILKTIKLDREDMVEAMAEKADVRLLARKVSYGQFETACDDLSRGLEHTLGKLNSQESLWQQVLDDIQREIETKLDKMELSPLKDFFNNKLRKLQDNLKQMASLRRDVDAAGTTRQLLRDVNCISCDANAVMPTENTATGNIKSLPAHFSIKPYLSYELDAIRKAQASNLPQRNLHDWETIDKQMPTKSPVKVRSSADKHLCNRYCGGSHTTTTPAQRVARLGHFVKQWGPDVLPLSSGLAAGDDGRLYKVVNTQEPDNKRGKMGDHHCILPKPTIAQECRCLDD